MTPTQVQRIYKLGGVLGMIKNDELHTLVYGLTGKEHIRHLSAEEFKTVEQELLNRIKLTHLSVPPTKKPEKKKSPPNNSRTASAGMTEGQQKKVWQLMYELAGLDQQQSDAKLGTRLCGIIKRQMRIDASAAQPFRWLDYQQGGQLIEILKKYITSAQSRSNQTERTAANE